MLQRVLYVGRLSTFRDCLSPLLLCLCCSTAAGAAEEPAAEKSAFNLVDMTKVKVAEGAAYKVVDGTAECNGRLVRRIDVSKPKAEEGTCSLVIAFRNKTNEAIHPQVTIKVYNRYGVLLGDGQVFWSVDSVGAGANRSADETIHSYNPSEVFRYSGIELPDDFSQPAFVVVHDQSR